ncbi:MAG TPA: glycosyltransferase family 1 protein [Candidatus Saccharimonadales bacterium]|nr:glycosyltransferase family 1 protein [Candidatus Saccharimonadales bacterium]
MTGTDRMAYNFLRELQSIDQQNTYWVITNKNCDFITRVITAPNFKVYPIQIEHRAVWLLFWLPWQLLRLKAQTFFSFHNLGGPSIKACRMVSSALDIYPVLYPDTYFPDKVRRYVILGNMRRAAKAADKLLAISRFTKQSVVSQYGVDPSKIEVVYLQADPKFFDHSEPVKMAQVRQQYQLPKQFVLAMGGTEPRKNAATVIKAHQGLPDHLRQSFPLMITGAKWHNREVDLQDDPYVCLTGFVEEADLPTLYQLAALFIFPSLYEGFGMPVLEAMASGTPVVTSATTSLPEVAGKAAVLVDPQDTASLTAAIQECLDKPTKLSEMRQAGYEQLKNFSWHAAAVQLHRLLVGDQD